MPIIDYKEKLLAISVETPVLFIHSSNDILTDKQQQMYEDLHEEAKKRGKLFVLDINDLSEDAREAILNLMEDYKEKIKEKHALIDIERRIILEDLPTLLGALRNKYKDVPENRGILYTDFDHDPKEDLQYIKANPGNNIRFPICMKEIKETSTGDMSQVELQIEINSIFVPNEGALAELTRRYKLSDERAIEELTHASRAKLRTTRTSNKRTRISADCKFYKKHFGSL